MSVPSAIGQLGATLQSVLFIPFAYTMFYNMIPTFLIAWENAIRLQDRFHDTFSYAENNTYDFIVVGGGSAGGLVANRLSELYSVLLIESGGVANPLHLVPALSLHLLNARQTDYSYKTVPQSKACLNSINQECLISGGKSLGGSSNLDSMAFLRGHSADFDNWAMITGDRSWSYDQVLPFFRRSEEFIGSTSDENARGRDGELRVREPDFLGLGIQWIRSGKELGLPIVDLNGQYKQGVSILQYPIRRGMRQSTDFAFIRPIRLGSRLRVLTHTTVTRVLFRDRTNMAYGVEYERFERTELAIATREVILSAGALGSPKLLMLSGVGPRQHLEDMGIPLRSDLPVGHNLQDHLCVNLGPFFVNTTSKTFLLDRDVTPRNIMRWITQGRGPLSTTGLQGAAVVSSSTAMSRGEQNWPDILLLLDGQGAHGNYAQQFARAHSLQEDELSRYYENSVGRDAFHIKVVGARPVSVGRVQLASTNPRDSLMIDPRYLEDGGSSDMKVLMEGVATALQLVENTKAFQSIGAVLTNVSLPGCEDHPLRSVEYWACYVQRFSISFQNPVGTASMGSVVDSTLKVRGTRGLRVIDSSIMPSIVSVPTFATTLMIGERGADFILQEHNSNNDMSTDSGNIGSIISSAVFGRNGLLQRNPFQKFISQEFDRMNPLPSLFRMPFNRSDFNPFSRFVGLFNMALPGSRQQKPKQTNVRDGGLGFVQNFLNINSQAFSLLSVLFGGINGFVNPNPSGGVKNSNAGFTLFPNNNFLFNNLFQQSFPQNNNQFFGSQQQRKPSAGKRPQPQSNLFDIIFPKKNNTITLPFQFPSFGQTSAPTTTRPTTTTTRPSLNFNLFSQFFNPTTSRRPQIKSTSKPKPTTKKPAPATTTIAPFSFPTLQPFTFFNNLIPLFQGVSNPSKKPQLKNNNSHEGFAHFDPFSFLWPNNNKGWSTGKSTTTRPTTTEAATFTTSTRSTSLQPTILPVVDSDVSTVLPQSTSTTMGKVETTTLVPARDLEMEMDLPMPEEEVEIFNPTIPIKLTKDETIGVTNPMNGEELLTTETPLALLLNAGNESLSLSIPILEEIPPMLSNDTLDVPTENPSTLIEDNHPTFLQHDIVVPINETDGNTVPKKIRRHNPFDKYSVRQKDFTQNTVDKRKVLRRRRPRPRSKRGQYS